MKKIQLVRFFREKKWADEFCRGNISLNWLGAFWGPDLDQIQNGGGNSETKEIKPFEYGRDDFYEGTFLVKGEDCSMLPAQLSKYIIGNTIFRVEEYKYCNLLCMCIVDYDDESKKIYLPDTAYFKENFGNYAVIIKDTDEFLRRINKCMSLSGFDYLYGRVNYTDIIGDYSITNRHSMQMQTELLTSDLSELIGTGRVLDVFDKDKLLYKQREWRLCVYRGLQIEKRYEPDPKMEALEDIAEVVSTDDVINVLMNQHLRYRYSLVQSNKNEEYFGNITREELQRKICADGKYRILVNMG